MSTVAANIKAARLAIPNLTQRRLAIALDVDTLAISRWENGRSAPTSANLAALAAYFDRDPGWFYTDHQRVAA